MLPLSPSSPPHYYGPIYSSSFYPICHVQPSRHYYKANQKAKTNSKRWSKHQNQIWQLLELSHQEFKTTVINKLRALTDEVDSMQEQMRNVSRGMEILREPKEKLEMKNTVTEMKSTFDGLIARLDKA